MPTGDLPRSMMCLLDRRLVGSVSPGARVTVVGILSIFQGKEGEHRQRSAPAGHGSDAGRARICHAWPDGSA